MYNQYSTVKSPEPSCKLQEDCVLKASPLPSNSADPPSVAASYSPDSLYGENALIAVLPFAVTACVLELASLKPFYLYLSTKLARSSLKSSGTYFDLLKIL